MNQKSSFEDIKGIGQKTLDKINTNNNEIYLNDSLKNLDFEFLSNLQLDSKSTNEIIKWSYEQKYNFKYTNPCKTDTVTKIQTEIFDSIKKNFKLDINKKKLISFSPTTNITEIKRRQEQLIESTQLIQSLQIEDLKEIQKLLKQEEIHTQFQKNIIYIFDEKELFDKFNTKFKNIIPLAHITKTEEIEDFQSYAQIRFIYSQDSKLIYSLEQMENILSIKLTNNIYEMIPELFFLNFKKNLNYITTTKDIIEKYDIPSNINLETINNIITTIETFEQNSKTTINLEHIKNLEKKSNVLLEQKLENINIKGTELLKALSSNSKIIDELKIQIKSEIFKESKLATDIIDFDNIPFQICEEKLKQIQESENNNIEIIKFNNYKHFFINFHKNSKSIKQSKQFLENLDYSIGLGICFQNHKTPIIHNQHFSFSTLKSKLLKETGFEVTPINYHIDRNQTIITGANSGGKTSLLNLITETHLLAMMGFLVDGHVKLKLYNNIYYFKKSSGTAGSGAFETTLNMFSKIENNESGSLILADEIESITEPGAATKIISATLDWFSKKKDKDLIFVTHLGKTLKDECPNARIDGIEASALDENLNLVVDRNPKINYLAKSTPQLIIERLTKKHDSDYFNHLLDRIKSA